MAANASASEIGHYAAGLLNLRDLAVPEPGVYGAIYNYGYVTSQLNDRHSNAIAQSADNIGWLRRCRRS